MFKVKSMLSFFNNKCWRRRMRFAGYFLSLMSATIMGRYFFLHYRRRAIGLPPGVIGLPIFGCLFSLAVYPQKLLQYTADRYGKICTIRVGNQDIVVVNDVKLCQKINTNTELNLNRPTSSLSVWGYPSYAVNDNGEKWRVQKNIVMKTFINQVNSGFIHSIFIECFDNIILPEIEKNLNKPYKPAKVIDFFTFSVHYLALFEDKITCLNDDRFIAFRDGIAKIMTQVQRFLIANKLPNIFHSLIYDHKLTMKYNEELIFPVLKQAVYNRKEYLKSNNNETRTMIDYMLMDKNISDEYVLGNVMQMVAGGLTSTALRLKHAIYNLALFPEIYEKIYNELINIYPNKKFTFDKVNQCHLLRAYVYECARTTSTTDISGGRLVTQENGIDIEEYHLPCNTIVMNNIYCIDKDNDFQTPHTINLNHFIDPKTQKFTIHNDFIGFGIGKRNCVGQGIARKHIYVAISTIILSGYRFDLSPHDPNHKLLQYTALERNYYWAQRSNIDKNTVIISKRN